MDQEIYNKNGLCVRCKGTNICYSCRGSGKKILEQDSVFPKGTEVPCPTCYGGGSCVFCRGKKRAARVIAPTVPTRS